MNRRLAVVNSEQSVSNAKKRRSALALSCLNKAVREFAKRYPGSFDTSEDQEQLRAEGKDDPEFLDLLNKIRAGYDLVDLTQDTYGTAAVHQLNAPPPDPATPPLAPASTKGRKRPLKGGTETPKGGTEPPKTS